MKKLRLKALELGATEILSREQLKNILGGGGTSCSTNGDCNNGESCCYGSCMTQSQCTQQGSIGSGSGGSGVVCPTGTVTCGGCGCVSPSTCAQHNGGANC